ncbi:hypothetical protein AgCh_010531 [Apium graveolens]
MFLKNMTGMLAFSFRTGLGNKDFNSQMLQINALRYKIYIEGHAWSVSEKYILAFDSITLLVKPDYYDFFVRSLKPLEHHYWPINKCKKYLLHSFVEYNLNFI